MRKPVIWVIALVVVVAVGLGAAWWITGRSESSAQSWLFSHTADGGSFTDNGDGTFTLSLTGVDPHMVAFTDRPDRDAAIVDAETVIDAWPQLFAESDPNAVLVEHSSDGGSDSVVVTLSEPIFTGSGVTFTATPLMDEPPGNLVRLVGSMHATPPVTFAHASLFIDDAGVVQGRVGNAGSQLSPVERGILQDLGYQNFPGTAGNGGTGGGGSFGAP